MLPTEEKIQKLKKSLEERHGREFTWEEASKAAIDLEKLAQLFFEIIIEKSQRQLKLKTNSKGFHLDGSGYTCSLCGNPASKENSWYDKYGIKCITCQNAINKKEIPPTLVQNKERWYSKIELEIYFNIKGNTIQKWIKNKILVARTIFTEKNQIHLQLFLIKENKSMLPPKKLVKSHMAKEIIKGVESYGFYPWYNFYDPQKHLKGYKIMDYLKVVDNNT